MVSDYESVLLYDSLQSFLAVPAVLVQQILRNVPMWWMVDGWVSVMALHSSC
jgi:hypothetical protein